MPSLTRQEAHSRAALLSVESYQVDLDLTRGPASFRSTTTVRFSATAPGATTFAELRPAELRAAWLNGAELAPDALADGRLQLPGLRDRNELVVEADFGYSRASDGMHRFVDPVDGQPYLYAQPSITGAPGFLACFDQPDLKAPVALRVTADRDWLVRGNGPARQTAPDRWELAAGPPLPTYLIALVAGPYHELRAEHDGVPLGLLARRSLAGELDREAPELFEVTAACLDRYHQLFGLRYPFGRYDQAFVPELSWGAMELPGCVLVRDELVFRGVATEPERERRAVLIAHEMAHMWFGNLVTMRWWDDLWLNESFADYLGWRVVAEATRWRTAWTSYAVGRKANGYAADQRPSTHPVAAAEVPDTVTALANFDGISYAKGSAVLRQLVAWIGDEAFLAGLRGYFDRFGYRNATLADLLAALSAASGRDLAGWAAVWLREPQVNTLRPETTADGGVQVRQAAPPAYPVLRPHRIMLGVYELAGDALVLRERVPVDLDPQRDGELTAVPGLTDVDGAVLVANDGDLTYAKLRLDGRIDPAGLLPAAADPLLRAVLWGSRWDMCRDGELPAGRLVSAAAAVLPAETEPGVFESILDRTIDPVVSRYLPPEHRPAGYAAVAGACRAVLEAAGPGTGAQLAAARGLVRCAGEPDLAWLESWLDGTATPPGLAVDAELRWAILLRLAVLGAAGEDRIAAEQERDPTARGAQEATRCRAARPDPAGKEWAWQLVTADRERSNRVLTAAAEGFWQPGQEDLTRPYAGRYFDEIRATAAWRPGQLLAGVATAAYPGLLVEPATLAAAQRRLAGDGLHPTVHRAIIDATDDLRRALAARALAESAPAEWAPVEPIGATPPATGPAGSGGPE